MTQKPRMVILGGGVGALTAAWHLTASPDWQERYEVVVYQMGWRLGGKGASSRNAEHGARIEEHGLHVWFGFYENAFALMRACYADPLLPPASLYRFEHAFRGQDFLCMMEQRQQQWSVWPLTMPQRNGEPGTPRSEPGVWSTLWELAAFLREHLREHLAALPAHQHPQTHLIPPQTAATQAGTATASPLERAHDLLQQLAQGLKHETPHDTWIETWMRELRDWARSRWEHLMDHEPRLRRALEVVELGSTVLIGIVADDLIKRGLSAIDDLEFQQWLNRHGARDFSLRSAPLRALYDCCFAFEDGDIDKPNFAAGAALGCALRIGLCYRGHVLYEMCAGMGDVVIAPLYQVLEARGVQFEFFQKVKSLGLSEDRRRIARIHFGRQATVREGRYQPLQNLPGIAQPVWPEHPLYDQLLEGDALRDGDINLESHWAQWPDREAWSLQLESEDQVVLGISLGALAPICAELAAARPEWRQLLAELPSMQTQAMQLWLTEDLQGLGWRLPLPAMVAAPEPFDVWADMSHLLAQENWPQHNAPRGLHYFCGPLRGDYLRDAPDDPTVPARAAAQVRAETRDWLDRYTRWLWPASQSEHDGGGFDWSLLYGDGGARGETRLDSQYLRANIDPSERYVLSPAGANLRRLASDASGFDNLVLAGDWTRTAINAGCVEAAVMSGMAASRALCGQPQGIVGEHFLKA